jgi:hypothetical protein
MKCRVLPLEFVAYQWCCSEEGKNSCFICGFRVDRHFVRMVCCQLCCYDDNKSTGCIKNNDHSKKNPCGMFGRCRDICHRACLPSSSSNDRQIRALKQHFVRHWSSFPNNFFRRTKIDSRALINNEIYRYWSESCREHCVCVLLITLTKPYTVSANQNHDTNISSIKSSDDTH